MKRFRIIAVLLIVTMMVPIYSTNVSAGTSDVPSGFITDDNGVMAYGYAANTDSYKKTFDIRGYFNGEWKKTTYNNYGYVTYLKVGDATKQIDVEENKESEQLGLKIGISFDFPNNGQTLQIKYKVKNEGQENIQFSLGTGADVQIGSDDNAEIKLFENGNGFLMISDHNSDKNSEGDYAQFNFFGKGYQGVTSVDNFWYGPYSSSKGQYYWYSNNENAVFYTNEQRIEQTGSTDSACSWNWLDETITAGATKEYSVLIGIGGAGSENAADGTAVSSPTGDTNLKLDTPVNGAEDFVVKVNGNVLTEGVHYTIKNANTTNPIISFTNNAGLNCQSVIEIEITGISEPILITNNIPHEYQYQANDDTDIITETCSGSCGHIETATLRSDSLVETTYTGQQIKAAKIDYSDNWKGGILEISYSNNISAGTATASCSIKGQSVSINYTIQNASQTVPLLNKVDETINGKADGKILGLTSEMEYSSDGTNYNKVTDINMNIAAGIYYVRYAAKANYNQSDPAVVTINPGRMLNIIFKADGEDVAKRGVVFKGNLTDVPQIPAKEGYTQIEPKWNVTNFTNITEDMVVEAVYTINKYTVTLPQNEKGYTVTSSDDRTLNHGDDFTFTFYIQKGYSKTDEFKVKVNGIPINLNNSQFTIENIKENTIVTVEGVVDNTAPEAEIILGTNTWKTFSNGITFDLFFRDSQTVRITAQDDGSGIKEIQYYLSQDSLDSTQVDSISDWQSYNGDYYINPDNKYIIYVKTIDNAGNITYISSDGIVLDKTNPVFYGIEDGGIYYGDKLFKVTDENFDTLIVDDVDVTDEISPDDEYTIKADNKEHKIVAKDKVGNEVTFTIYTKNDPGEYKDEEIKKPVSPTTGDVNAVALWAGITMLACGYIVFVVRRKKGIS